MQMFLCPQCGHKSEYDPWAGSAQCPKCGYKPTEGARVSGRVPLKRDAYQPFLDELLAHWGGTFVPDASFKLPTTGLALEFFKTYQRALGEDPMLHAGYSPTGFVRNYHPQQMATMAMFRRHPREVWKWYLYRAGVCRDARPNAGHLALVALEERLADRFLLITQNVDGLHLRAGNSPDRTYQIHGNVFFMRCSAPCGGTPQPLPESLVGRPPRAELTAAEDRLLRCPDCGAAARPHVLWFDEMYDEHEDYRFDDVWTGAESMTTTLFVGTSFAVGVTALLVQAANLREVPGYSVDPGADPNRTPPGIELIRAPAEELLPAVCERLGAASG